MKKIFSLFALVMILAWFILPTPALAVGQATSYRASVRVAECYGQLWFVTNGYTRTYEDSTVKVVQHNTYLLGGGTSEDIRVWRQSDNALVGHWVNGVKILFLPDDSWEVYLLDLSRTCPNYK